MKTDKIAQIYLLIFILLLRVLKEFQFRKFSRLIKSNYTNVPDLFLKEKKYFKIYAPHEQIIHLIQTVNHAC